MATDSSAGDITTPDGIALGATGGGKSGGATGSRVRGSSGGESSKAMTSSEIVIVDGLDGPPRRRGG
jgi:hypothetical protein